MIAGTDARDRHGQLALVSRCQASNTGYFASSSFTFAAS